MARKDSKMKKILLVDDDENIREAIPHVLSFMAPKEFEFETAKNGKEALEKVLAQGEINYFYALVTDFNMPEMDGGELIREILKREIFFPRIIVVSGEVDNEMILKDILTTKPYVFFLKKPTSPESLLNIFKD